MRRFGFGAGWRCSRAFVGDVAAAVALAVVDRRPGSRVHNVAEPDAPRCPRCLDQGRLYAYVEQRSVGFGWGFYWRTAACACQAAPPGLPPVPAKGEWLNERDRWDREHRRGWTNGRKAVPV